jgi:molecular chaperone DnaJ
VAVPTLTGETIIKVPPGTQHGKLLRLKGLGVPSLKHHRHAGDQNIRVKVEIPSKLTARQKELLAEFARESGMSPDKEGDGFFEKMRSYFE